MDLRGTCRNGVPALECFQSWRSVHCTPSNVLWGLNFLYVLKKSLRRCDDLRRDGLLKSMPWWAPSMAAEMATDSGSNGDGDSNSSSNGNSSSSSGGNGNGDSDSSDSGDNGDNNDSGFSGGSSSDNGLLGIVLICHHLVQIGNRSSTDVRLSMPAGLASLSALSSSPLRQARP